LSIIRAEIYQSFASSWALLLGGERVDMKMVEPIGLFYENTNDIFRIVRAVEAPVLPCVCAACLNPVIQSGFQDGEVCSVVGDCRAPLLLFTALDLNI
jgi:hypothetical protein